jgi:chromosome segregation ATPase
MTPPVKINAFEVENMKRVRLVQVDCSGKALTVIGGDNGQGKTSVLDAIAYALGGEKFRPSNIQRDGAAGNATVAVRLSNGLLVERKGKNASLKITDATGKVGGQNLLDSLIGQMALNLPKFMAGSSREKADTLLRILGIGDKLAELEKAEATLYERRNAHGQVVRQKEGFVAEMAYYPDAPEVPITATALLQENGLLLQRNSDRQRQRNELANLQAKAENADNRMATLLAEKAQLQKQLVAVNERIETGNGIIADYAKQIADAKKTVAELQDESTAEIQEQIKNIEDINAKVRANLDRAKAEEDAKALKAQYDTMSGQLDAIRNERMALLVGAKLPLPELTVEKGELVYRGQLWDGMSASEQLIVATAIVRKLNPNCGFVLLDKLEQMDMTTLRTFGAWLEAEGLQAIGTRVSTGDECSIIIEDGMVLGAEVPATVAPTVVADGDDW